MMTMTNETRTTIEPNDIVAIELQCTQCQCRFSCMFDQWRMEPTGCRNCGNNWGAFRDNEIRQMEHLFALLRTMSNLQTKGILPFRLRFEIAQPRKESL